MTEERTLTQIEIDQRVFDLYDEYCHGQIDRRAFLARAAIVTVGGLAMAQALLPRYARAQTISFTDERIKVKGAERSIVLTGEVSDAIKLDEVMSLATSYEQFL